MSKTKILLMLLPLTFCLTACGWDVFDPNNDDEPVVPGPTPSQPVNPEDFAEVIPAEISATITSPDSPHQAHDITTDDHQIHITGYGCEGNMYFKWNRGDALYAVNQRTGEVIEIVTQQNDVITATFTGYAQRGVRSGDTFLIYNHEGLTPTGANAAAGTLRFQTGIPEDLRPYSAMAGTALAVSYDNVNGIVRLSDTVLEHQMTFLHLRALIDNQQAANSYAAMSIFAETTTNSNSLKADGAPCISKYYNLKLYNDKVTIETDDTHENYAYLRCSFPKDRHAVKCTEQMVKDDPRASGKSYIDCFMALNPNSLYLDAYNYNRAVEDFVVNLYARNEVTYNQHVRLAGILRQLKAGEIVCINIDMTDAENTTTTPAITVPGFHFSLSPGYVCGHRDNMYDEWEYEFTGLWKDCDPSVLGKNQAIIRGHRAMNELYNEFFVWGGTTPDDHYYNANIGGNSSLHKFNTVYKSEFVDVASLCDDGYWRSFRMNELDAIASSMSNNSNGSSCSGYYESKEIDPVDGSMHIYHVYGLYVGTSTQPRYEDQDQYFFFPSHLDIADKEMSGQFSLRFNTPYGIENRTYYVGTPATIRRYDYNHSCNGKPVVIKFDMIPGENLSGTRTFISIWSGAEGEDNDGRNYTAYRIVFDDGNVRIGDYSKGLARFVRGVRY